MSITRNIKCPNCGIFNTNKEYCKNCNTLISNEKKIALKVEKLKQEQINKAVYEKENPNFVERLKKHPFFLYRFIGWVLYSTIVVVSAVGSALAWLIAMVAAG